MKITLSQPVHRRQFGEEEINWIEKLLLSCKKDTTGFNRRMFDEDFSQIFHYSNRRSGNLFEVKTNDHELSDRLLGNIQTKYGPHPADKAIYELIEDIARSVISFGEAYYSLHDNKNNDKIHISSFSADKICKFIGLHFQYLPKRNDSYSDEVGKKLPREIIILDRKKLLCFQVPKYIKKMLCHQNKSLATLDKYHGLGSSFIIQATHDNPNPKNYFDFRVWREVEDQALYRATRKTGWNGRKYDAAKRSEFFDCFRLIRFRRNQIKLRDSLLTQLSDELTRVGRYYNPAFHIFISPSKALPSTLELDDLETKLAGEEVDFPEIIKFCFKR